MLLVYWSHWENWNTEWNIRLESYLTEEKRKKVPYYQEKRKQQTLVAYGLLHFGLRKILKREIYPKLCYGTMGKPELKDYKNLQFNISHTDGCAVCAFSNRTVGVDVEKIRAVPKERSQKLKLPLEPEGFYQGWVKRESLTKLRGESALLCRTSVKEKEGEHLYLLSLRKDYAAALAAEELGPITVKEIEPAAL